MKDPKKKSANKVKQVRKKETINTQNAYLNLIFEVSTVMCHRTFQSTMDHIYDGGPVRLWWSWKIPVAQ